jgi:hypothetical protein
VNKKRKEDVNLEKGLVKKKKRGLKIEKNEKNRVNRKGNQKNKPWKGTREK